MQLRNGKTIERRSFQTVKAQILTYDGCGPYYSLASVMEWIVLGIMDAVEKAYDQPTDQLRNAVLANEMTRMQIAFGTLPSSTPKYEKYVAVMKSVNNVLQEAANLSSPLNWSRGPESLMKNPKKTLDDTYMVAKKKTWFIHGLRFDPPME